MIIFILVGEMPFVIIFRLTNKNLHYVCCAVGSSCWTCHLFLYLKVLLQLLRSQLEEGPTILNQNVFSFCRPFMGTPILLYSNKSTLIQHRSNQRVHLWHVASEPKQPAADTNQHQNNLKHAFVWTFWYEPRQNSANNSKDSSENNKRQNGKTHCESVN